VARGGPQNWVARAFALAQGVQDDPLARQMLADLYVRSGVQRRYAEKISPSACWAWPASPSPPPDRADPHPAARARLAANSSRTRDMPTPANASQPSEPGPPIAVSAPTISRMRPGTA
jgi:hypothetical protein